MEDAEQRRWGKQLDGPEPWTCLQLQFLQQYCSSSKASTEFSKHRPGQVSQLRKRAGSGLLAVEGGNGIGSDADADAERSRTAGWEEELPCRLELRRSHTHAEAANQLQGPPCQLSSSRHEPTLADGSLPLLWRRWYGVVTSMIELLVAWHATSMLAFNLRFDQQHQLCPVHRLTSF